MSTIREYLEKIKTAVHGKDVRQAIHDAIRQCYDDGRAGAIDLQAREDISGLDEKKADKTALLQEKEERKNEIAVERERINNLAKLEPGSTTGDAELVDARVDKNGNAHDNVGEHIREVTSQLSEEIVKHGLFTSSTEKVLNCFIDFVPDVNVMMIKQSAKGSFLWHIGLEADKNYSLFLNNNTRCRVAYTNKTAKEISAYAESGEYLQFSTYFFENDNENIVKICGNGNFKNILVYTGSDAEVLLVDDSVLDILIKPINADIENLNDNVKNLINKKVYPIIGSPTFCVSTDVESNNIDNMTHEQVYSIYDTLLAEYPEWISRSGDIGTDSAGNPIRHYIVRMQKPVTNGADYPNVDSNEWIDKYDYKNILINAGTHGDEKTSVYGTALFIDELVKSTEDWAVFIKSNFILHIIPLLNVWGFDNFSRENANSININRDFVDFVTSESTALVNFIESLGEKLRVIIDSHNTQSNIGFLGAPPTCEKWDMYLQSATKYAASNYERLTRFYGNKALFPYFYGWKSSSGGGTLAAWGNAHNYYALTVEAPRAINGGANNDAKTCTLVKDTLGTFIQMFGVLD